VFERKMTVSDRAIRHPEWGRHLVLGKRSTACVKHLLGEKGAHIWEARENERLKAGQLALRRRGSGDESAQTRGKTKGGNGAGGLTTNRTGESQHCFGGGGRGVCGKAEVYNLRREVV